MLVLDIRVPEPGFDSLWRTIFEAWPSYLGYATSFITIGGIWLAHHSPSAACSTDGAWRLDVPHGVQVRVS